MDGAKIRELRLERGWNQTHVAVYSGIGQTVISEIETGKRNPSARTLSKLADAFGVRVPDLFVVEEDPGKVLAPPESPEGGAFLTRSLTRRIEAAGNRWWAYLTDPPAPRATFGELQARWLEIGPQADDFDAEIGELSLVLADATAEDRRALYEAQERLIEARDSYYGEMLRRHEIERQKTRKGEALEAAES